MSIQDIFIDGGGTLLVLLTLIQISPVKINPWSWAAKVAKAAARVAGRAFNADVLNELAEVKDELQKTKTALNDHVTMDDRRTADGLRTQILHFNNQLLRDIKHTKEEFIEVLAMIDAYEKYCEANPDYPNNRAILAIENIRDTYKRLMKRRDFLQDSTKGEEEQTE